MMEPSNMKRAILSVGNDMMGDDGAGPLVIEKLGLHQHSWKVFNGGSFPEGESGHIREYAPDLLVVIDATEMGLNPGEIRRIPLDSIATMSMMTTHSMPINFLIEDLQEAVGKVIMLGIQPDIVGFSYPMSPTVQDSAAKLAEQLCSEEWSQIKPLEVLSEPWA